MFVRCGASVSAAVFCSVMAANVPFAHADEAYLCGPDTIVYVKATELEAKKRSDPCIAAYFGLEIGAPDSATAAQAPETRSAAEFVDTSAGSSGAAGVQQTAGLEFKSITDASVHPHRNAGSRVAELNWRPRPSPGTDFRNVRVINAATPEEQWFKHTH